MELILGIIFGTLLLLAFVFLELFLRKRWHKKTYVIGAQYARAMEAEELRKSRGATGKSPMPDGKYDFWRGEESLINPAPSSLDAMLRESCQRFAKNDEQSRAEMRASISMEEFYTLITFSRRAAVFGIRERKEAFETSESLARFSKGITGILSRYAGKG